MAHLPRSSVTQRRICLVHVYTSAGDVNQDASLSCASVCIITYKDTQCQVTQTRQLVPLCASHIINALRNPPEVYHAVSYFQARPFPRETLGESGDKGWRKRLEFDSVTQQLGDDYLSAAFSSLFHYRHCIVRCKSPLLCHH